MLNISRRAQLAVPRARLTAKARCDNYYQPHHRRHLLRYSPVLLQQRHVTTDAVPETSSETSDALVDEPVIRTNALNIQHLSAHIHKQVFPGGCKEPPAELIALARKHLKEHRLGDKTERAPEISFDLPELQGETLGAHFHRLGVNASEPYRKIAEAFAVDFVPEPPKKWIEWTGWTKYGRSEEGVLLEPERVEYPDEDAIVFDVEVLWKISPFPVVACAASKTAWYGWISPWVLEEGASDRQLIPLGPEGKVIVGHNIGYDRARVKEEYNIVQTKNCFLDTMSLHVAVNGMCSRQRPTWLKHKKNRELRDKIANETNPEELSKLLESLPDEIEQELWVGRSSINSLRDVAQFHCNVSIDKAMRDSLGEMDVKMLSKKLQETMAYCAADVAITHKVYKSVLPGFFNVCPHPVSFAALRHLSSVILPVNETWDKYIESAENTYHTLLEGVERHLRKLAEDALRLRTDPAKYENDPWLRQLDWSGMEIKMKKDGTPYKNQRMPGMPKWYKELFPKVDEPMKLSVRTRIAPILLRLTWKTYPLVWTDKYGWTFRVPADNPEAWAFEKQNMVQCTELSEEKPHVSADHLAVYYKVPHKDGQAARCSTPLAKSYQRYFDDHTLDSQYAVAKEALEMNAACSYWISARERIRTQNVVWEDDTELGFETDKLHDVPANDMALGLDVAERDGAPAEPINETELVSEATQGNEKPLKTGKLGIILPQLIPMGTITRRAVEKTWLTASNAKKKRVGSELKSMIKAPPGYYFVGADVDSEELWIAGLVGDAQFKLHGGNAIGFMTLEGTKKEGTDMHSRTAEVLGISRNDAKIFNYGRIYGAGLKFAASLLRQFNPSMEESKATEVASNLYKTTKGINTTKRGYSPRKFWRGGTESFVFNKLEEMAEQDEPRTPVLGAGITEALQRRYINKGSFLTSRINWAIQSSGVDYLHLLVISMDYLIRSYKIDARLMITVHDEIRYLVKDKDRYRAAMALQVSNLWTRAMFAQQMGIDDLPQGVAFFSAVDIDHVLRKEVDLDCVTPSNPNPIPHGESIDIFGLLAKGNEAALDPDIFEKQFDMETIEYKERPTVMSELNKGSNLFYLRAQTTKVDSELTAIQKDYRLDVAARKPVPPRKSKGAGAPPAPVPQWREHFLDLQELQISPGWGVGKKEFKKSPLSAPVGRFQSRPKI